MTDNESPSLEAILAALMNEVVFGRTHLKIARAIRAADPVVVHAAQTFFGLTQDAHLEAAQMYAAKLYDKTQRSVTVKSVLAEANRLAGSFFHCSAEEVRTVMLPENPPLCVLKAASKNSGGASPRTNSRIACRNSPCN